MTAGHQQRRHVPSDPGHFLATIEPDHGGSRPSVQHAGPTQKHGQAVSRLYAYESHEPGPGGDEDAAA